MSKPEKPPEAPESAGESGRALWDDVVGRFVLDQHETALLIEAVRTVDILDELAAQVEVEGPIISGKAGARANPAVVEQRQQRITLARLLAELRLPSGDEGDEANRRAQRRGGSRGSYRLRAIS